MKVLIFGLGLNNGGLGSAKFFAKSGAEVRVTDLRNAKILKPSLEKLRKFKNISYTLGQHKYADINWANLIIKNPAVKPNNPYIKYALKNGKKVEMDMGIFLDFVKPFQIIGVTGTKGKSTTASLIYEVLKSTGQEVILAGNLGLSVLDVIPHAKPETLIVLEISSFQLESFANHKVSPKWAVITNLTPDHLNYYKNLKEYVNAKKLIGKFQTAADLLFIRKNDPIVDQPNFLKGMKSKIIRFSKFNLPRNFHPNVLGEHNLQNLAAALTVGKTLGLNEKTIGKVLSNFKGIPFRMQLIKKWHGIQIINDTCASSPEASAKAVETFPGSLLICGGMNKGMKYMEYAKLVSRKAKKVFFLKGNSTDEIKKLIKEKKLIAGEYNNLTKLLSDLKKEVKKGDIILFSPAATSFNLFQNEFDRGRKFNAAVQRIFK